MDKIMPQASHHCIQGSLYLLFTVCFPSVKTYSYWLSSLDNTMSYVRFNETAV